MATNAPNYVSLTSGNYDTQLADILRRQKYAELLAQQGNEDIKVENVNGVPTPISPFQGLAKVFQTGMGAYLGGKAAEDAAALKKSERSQLIENLKNYETAPGDTISMPEQSISANMPAIPRATFDRATGTLVPGADTQTTPTNINIPKYELAAASRPRTLTEKGDLALQYAQNGSPETSAMWTGRYADVAKKQQLLANLLPRVDAIIANPDAPKNIVNDLKAAKASQDVDSMASTLKTALDKMTANAPSAMDSQHLDAFKTSNARRIAKGLPPESIDEYKNRMDVSKFTAEQNIRAASERSLALYRSGLGGPPSVTEKNKQDSINAWRKIPGNENGTVAQYDAYAAGLTAAAQAKGRLGATLDFGESISIDNPTVVAAGKSQLMGNPMTVPQIYKGAVDRYIAAQKDAYTPAAQNKYTRNAQLLSANYMKLPEYQALASARVPLNRINAALKQPHTSASDQELIDAFTQLSKASNAARSVTDSQVKLLTDYSSWADMASRFMNRAGGRGGALSAQQRKDIQKLATATASQYQKSYGPLYNELASRLEENNIPKRFWTIPDLASIQSGGKSANSNGPVPASAEMSQAEWDTLTPDELGHFK